MVTICMYETNSENQNQCRYKGRWSSMKILTDYLSHIKDTDSKIVELKYTRHGPVVFEDRENNLAYAVRAAWMRDWWFRPFVASLRMDQASNLGRNLKRHVIIAIFQERI